MRSFLRLAISLWDLDVAENSLFVVPSRGREETNTFCLAFFFRFCFCVRGVVVATGTATLYVPVSPSDEEEEEYECCELVLDLAVLSLARELIDAMLIAVTQIEQWLYYNGHLVTA